MREFIIIGENIHCTRSVKSGGTKTASPDNREGVVFVRQNRQAILPLPDNWPEISPAYKEGRIRHISLAVYQALNGRTEEERGLGRDYLCWAAENQINKGTHFLDINVDEYSTDASERIRVMRWLAGFLSERYDIPLSIDTSDIGVLRAGLENCRGDKPALVNSVSLERPEAAEIAVQFKAGCVVSAAGLNSLPSTPEAKLENLSAVVAVLERFQLDHERMHLDPLVLPVSVDAANGSNLLESVKLIRKRWERAHISGGLSNISFGMPRRKLLNTVFIYLFRLAGGDGGIIDPLQVSIDEVNRLDTGSEPFVLAKNVIEGNDLFCAEYIRAYREGRF